VRDGDDGGRHVPGKAHEGAHHHQDRHPEQVQVIARAFLSEPEHTRSRRHEHAYTRAHREEEDDDDGDSDDITVTMMKIMRMAYWGHNPQSH